jgi:predicted RNA-binding protein with PIN domain
VRYLVDGYNLMHAAGLAVPEHSGPKALESARKRFLDWMADLPAIRKATAPPNIRIIFDAQNSHKDYGTSSYRGFAVTFSFQETADDYNETLVSRESQPEKLHVVSNDHRLKIAARKAKCQPMTCEAFIDWLMSAPTTPTLSKNPNLIAAEKPTPSANDTEEFLDVFSKPK